MSALDKLVNDVVDGNKDAKSAVNESIGVPEFSNGEKVQIVHGMGMAVAGTPGVYKGEANGGFAIVETENGEVQVPAIFLQKRENENK